MYKDAISPLILSKSLSNAISVSIFVILSGNKLIESYNKVVQGDGIH